MVGKRLCGTYWKADDRADSPSGREKASFGVHVGRTGLEVTAQVGANRALWHIGRPGVKVTA